MTTLTKDNFHTLQVGDKITNKITTKGYAGEITFIVVAVGIEGYLLYQLPGVVGCSELYLRRNNFQSLFGYAAEVTKKP